jgi:hypothetical protein
MECDFFASNCSVAWMLLAALIEPRRKLNAPARPALAHAKNLPGTRCLETPLCRPVE